jgi:2-polyprenyl-3-methyl-5-hydroxy-6-metoxy-1,4-benzoquinol methylase
MLEKGYGSLSEYPANPNADNYVLEVIQRYFSPPANILDLGCGTGNNLHALAHKKYHVYGVDVLKGHLLEAERLATQQGISNYTHIALWDIFSLQSFPFSTIKGRFSAVIATYLFGHCNDDVFRKTVGFIAESLCNGGMFIFTNMTKFDMELEAWERSLSPLQLGITERSEEYVCETLQSYGFSKMPESRRFLNGEMSFWALPEKHYSWFVFCKT